MNKQDEEKAREISYHYLQQVDCFKKTKYDEDDILSTARDAALEMAAWKEQQFTKIGYTKEQLRAMGFGFTLNGDIVTPKDEEESIKEYLNYQKQKMIEKTVQWWSTVPDDTYGHNPCKVFIEDFKKAMEGE